MRRLLLPIALIAGCAHNAPSTGQIVSGARSALVAVDIAAEAAAPLVVEGRRLGIERCRKQELETEEEREECLGPLAEPIAPVAQEASEAYDAAVEALDKLEAILRKLDQMRGAAAAEGAK